MVLGSIYRRSPGLLSRHDRVSVNLLRDAWYRAWACYRLHGVDASHARQHVRIAPVFGLPATLDSRRASHVLPSRRLAAISRPLDSKGRAQASACVPCRSRRVARVGSGRGASTCRLPRRGGVASARQWPRAQVVNVRAALPAIESDSGASRYCPSHPRSGGWAGWFPAVPITASIPYPRRTVKRRRIGHSTTPAIAAPAPSCHALDPTRHAHAPTRRHTRGQARTRTRTHTRRARTRARGRHLSY